MHYCRRTNRRTYTFMKVIVVQQVDCSIRRKHSKCGLLLRLHNVTLSIRTPHDFIHNQSSMADTEDVRRLTILHRARLVIAKREVQFQRASTSHIHRILKLLHAPYLLQRRVKSGVRRQNTPANLRYLFCHHATHILGWKDRRPEGHPFGFAPVVYQVLRNDLWPDRVSNGRHTSTSATGSSPHRIGEHIQEETAVQSASPSWTINRRVYNRSAEHHGSGHPVQQLQPAEMPTELRSTGASAESNL